jgi:hypothetical protein
VSRLRVMPGRHANASRHLRIRRCCRSASGGAVLCIWNGSDHPLPPARTGTALEESGGQRRLAPTASGSISQSSTDGLRHCKEHGKDVFGGLCPVQSTSARFSQTGQVRSRPSLPGGPRGSVETARAADQLRMTAQSSLKLGLRFRKWIARRWSSNRWAQNSKPHHGSLSLHRQAAGRQEQPVRCKLSDTRCGWECGTEGGGWITSSCQPACPLIPDTRRASRAAC